MAHDTLQVFLIRHIVHFYDNTSSQQGNGMSTVNCMWDVGWPANNVISGQGSKSMRPKLDQKSTAPESKSTPLQLDNYYYTRNGRIFCLASLSLSVSIAVAADQFVNRYRRGCEMIFHHIPYPLGQNALHDSSRPEKENLEATIS